MPPAALSLSATADESKCRSGRAALHTLGVNASLYAERRRRRCSRVSPGLRDSSGRGGRRKVMRSWCCSPKQALIWSAGAVFSPLSRPSLLLSKKCYKVGAAEDILPSQHIYIFAAMWGYSAQRCWQATPLVIQRS